MDQLVRHTAIDESRRQITSVVRPQVELRDEGVDKWHE